MIHFDVFKNFWFRGVVYGELLRQNYDLRTTFPPFHPTEWLAHLLSANRSSPSQLRFNTSDTEASALEDFIYNLDTELDERERRGLWTIFTNTSEHQLFVQSVNEEFTKMTILNWSDPLHANYSSFKHYAALKQYLDANPLSAQLRSAGPQRFFDLLSILGSSHDTVIYDLKYE
jgi:hypothetical protein